MGDLSDGNKWRKFRRTKVGGLKSPLQLLTHTHTHDADNQETERIFLSNMKLAGNIEGSRCPSGLVKGQRISICLGKAVKMCWLWCISQLPSEPGVEGGGEHHNSLCGVNLTSQSVRCSDTDA